MTGAVFYAPVTAAEAAATLPYYGNDPAELSPVADRISDARMFLYRLNDGIFDARPKLSGAWLGSTGALGDSEIGRLYGATEAGIERLDGARSALLDCLDRLDDTRSEIDLLRAEWTAIQQRLRGALQQIRLEPDPLSNPDLRKQVVALSAASMQVIQSWQLQGDRADQAVQRCRSRLVDSLRGDQVSTTGHVGFEDLGVAIGTDQLVTDDLFLLTAEGAKGAWDRLSDSGKAFALAAAGTFPPATAASPLAMAQSWRDLTPLEQQALIHAIPLQVGSLDGLPSDARDEANRLYLDSRQAEVEAALAALPTDPTAVYATGTDWSGGFGWNPYALDGVTAVDLQRSALESELGNLRTVSAQLMFGLPPRLLLGIEPGGRGQAIVAIGNPDRASNVATFVPGTSSSIASLAVDLDRSQAMLESADAAAGSRSTAVITWIGYDSPADLGEARYDSYADNGAPQLAEFQSGLRASHLGAPALNTVVTHSYAGLLVAGAATGGSVLQADQVIFVGSAGLEIPSVEQLQLAGVPASQVSDHVFSTVASNDPINATGWVHPGVPTGPGFGTTTFDSDPYPPSIWAEVLATTLAFGGSGGAVLQAADLPISPAAHGSYWTPGSAELQTMGQIIAGVGPR